MNEVKGITREERLLFGIRETLKTVARDKPVRATKPITSREEILLESTKELLTIIATNNTGMFQEEVKKLAIREAVVNEKITRLLKQLSKVPPGEFSKGLKNGINNIEKNIVPGKNKPVN